MQEKDWWPSNTPEWVFLPRAFDLLGTVRHGVAWDGREVDYQGAEIRVDDAFALLYSLRSLPSVHPLAVKFRTALLKPNDILRTWEHVRDHIDPKEVEQTNICACRLRDVQSYLKTEFAAGRVISGSRRRTGGSISELGFEIWNCEGLTLAERFRGYEIDIEYPFGGKPKGFQGTPSYIFVSKASLDGVLHRTRPEASTTRRVSNFGTAKRYLQQRFNANPDELMPGLDADWETIKGLPGCRDISRERVDELRREVAPNLIRGRGRPPVSKPRTNPGK